MNKINLVLVIERKKLWGRLHIDYKSGLKNIDGYKYILVLRDAYSGWTKLIPTKTMTASETAENIVNNWICQYGIPDVIISDNATNFLSVLLRKILKLLNIDRRNSSIFRPTSNSSVERVMKVINANLRKVLNKNHLNWLSLIHNIQYIINTTISRATNMSPYFIVFGITPRSIFDINANIVNDLTGDNQERFQDFIDNIKSMRNLAASNTLVNQMENKRYYDTGAKEAKLEIGEYVLL